ncbi:MAG: putative OB-fold protein [Myxococcota bacterium]|jgi:uncharacterized OB-fold protein
MSADVVESAEGLFADTPNGPRLLGSRCASCKTPYFPRSAGCHNPDCDLSKMEDESFGPNGVIWSLSIQNYQPPHPVVTSEPWAPFGVGMIDLPEGLRVLGRIIADDPEAVDVGDAVELVLAPLGVDKNGSEVISWQFRPI